MREIRAVAFDVGNVLIDWNPEALVDPLATATGLTGAGGLEAARKLYARSKRRLDLGDLAPREFHAELNEAIREQGGRPVAYDELRRMWCGTVRPRKGTVELVRRLRPGIPYAIWSDTDPIHFGWWSRWLPIIAPARSVWVSFLVGVAKPDQAFYEGALASLGVPAAEVLFVDDTERNVEGAIACGIDAVRVTTVEDLESALETRRLLLPR